MRTALVLFVATLTSNGFAEVLLDQMELARRQTGYALGNAIGGDNAFGNGKQVAAQIANDFRTTSTGHVIVQVEVANLLIFEDTRVSDAQISIYRESDGRPEEGPVYSERFSEINVFTPTAARGFRNTYFDDDYFGLFGTWTTISGLNIALEPDIRYFICVQVFSGPDDFAYTIHNQEILFGVDSYVRDGPEKEDDCRCGWGFTDWRSFEEVGRPAGEAAYRVIAAGSSPPPPPMPGPEQFIAPAETEQPPRPMARAERRNKQREEPCKRD